MNDGDFVGDSEEEAELAVEPAEPPIGRNDTDETMGEAALSLFDTRSDSDAAAAAADVPTSGDSADNVDAIDARVSNQVQADGSTSDGYAIEVAENRGAGEEHTIVHKEPTTSIATRPANAIEATNATDTAAMADETMPDDVPEPVETGPRAKFKVGDVVHVAARTWPGINKLGGAGKIASVITDTSDGDEAAFLYNVKYMLGGFEKRIEEEYIQYLDEALASGVRQHKERVYYHDEYLNDPHKRKKQVVAADAGQAIQSANTSAPLSVHADASKGSRETVMGKKVKSRDKPVLMDAPEIEYHIRSSDDSDYDGSDGSLSDAPDEAHDVTKRLDDKSFILSGNHTTGSERKRKRELPKKSMKRSQDKVRHKSRRDHHDRHRADDVEANPKARKKRSLRIILSDDEDDQRSSHEDVDVSHQRRIREKKRSTRRRYIGGYEHGSEDAEGSFIQPEGNPAELPDDVAKELKFKLGTTKAELRAQLEQLADRLQENLGEFEKKKNEVAMRLEVAATLEAEDLQEVNREVINLGEFIRNKFIRSGEDVMNLIIKMLERKGASLPDRIDLQFENWKQQIAEHDAWVKQSMRLLGSTFDRRGFRDVFVDELRHGVSSSESGSSSDPDQSENDDFEMLVDDIAPMTTREDNGTTTRVRKRQQGHKQLDRRDLPLSAWKRPRQVSRKRPRDGVRIQSSLDSFAVPVDVLSEDEMFKSSKAVMPSNFRFVRGLDEKILKDPRWDWARKLKRVSRESGFGRSRPVAALQTRTKSHLDQKDRSGRGNESVMEAVLKLRDKRYRDRSSRQTGYPQHRVMKSSMVPDNHHIDKTIHLGVIREQESRMTGSKVSSTGVDQINFVAKPDPRKWTSIFDALVAEEAVTLLEMNVTMKYVQLGDALHDVNCDDDELLSYSREPLTLDTVVNRTATIRQSLSMLREAERVEMNRILKEKREFTANKGIAQSTSWVTLGVDGDDFHAKLKTYADDLRNGLMSIHPGDMTNFVRLTIVELAHLLKQIPDCATVFRDSPAYGFFFVVASSEARTSPLITAICRTYWYSIQLLIFVKRTCESRWPNSRSEWGPIFTDILSPNRVALACCLFLIDLYIHVPSTHRLASQPETYDFTTDVEAPALSLWNLLYDMFASGVIQSNKSEETSSLWHLLQTAYKQGLVDVVGVSYAKRESFGGYIMERAPLTMGDKDEDLQGKLLAADVLWDLTCLLSTLFLPIACLRPLVLSSSWNLIRQLISTSLIGFLPFVNLQESDTTDEEFQLLAHGFKLRVLRRLLVLSAILPPENDILEKLFSHSWDCVVEEDDHAVLPSIIAFIGEIRQLRDEKNETRIRELARQHAMSTTHSVELFCKIAVVQLSKLEKTIHRVRYRQPVLRAVSSRVDKHKSMLSSASNGPSASDAPVSSARTDVAVKSWNWGKNGSKGPTSRSGSAEAQLAKGHALAQVPSLGFAPKEVVAEVKSIQSIVLMLGLATLYLDDESTTNQQSARRKREIKREVDFFCKELSSVSCDIPETSVQLCECLSAIGTASIDVGASYSTPFKSIDELMKWTTNKIQDARTTDGGERSRMATQLKLLADATSSCLVAIRALSAQLLGMLGTREGDDLDDAQSCSGALGSGLAGVMDGIVDGALPLKFLDLVIEIMALWMPMPKIMPTKCLEFARSVRESPVDEFDEFDDPEMMDLLATVDLETPGSSTTNPVSLVRAGQDQARHVALAYLRLSVQRLVLSLPPARWYTFHELFVIDLMGSMVATGKFPFSWSTVCLTSLKPRMLAPRLMGSILQYRGESDWFSTCFMSEHNADVEVCSLWLTATLDLRSLLPTMCCLPRATEGSENVHIELGAAKTAKYSSYWLSLTDGIMVKLLKEDPVVRYKMDQSIYQLLRNTAASCSYGTLVRQSSDPDDVRGLYSMHTDVFRSFCSSAGEIWQSMSSDPARHRQDMNRFRIKMMDTQRGVFVALPETYEINLRAVCKELDRKNMNWYSLAGRFLDEFHTPNCNSSLHTVDDATSVLDRQLTDSAIRPLIVLFKFMYDCVDSFLFHCGGMAIGQQNIFYSIIELMFRQARCAEFPTAEKRLKIAVTSNASGTTRAKPTAAGPLTDVSPPCVAFTESVRLFFAYQKYPSLLNWFAQNLDTYQTLKGGWSTSPLRILLYNVFDPHGPLGIHSYYPIQGDSNAYQTFDPRTVRREAFYFACGLLNCKCSTSYEHTRCSVQPDQEMRRSQLRRFVLADFITELSRAAALDDDNMDESLLPYFQLVKGLLNHLNLDDSMNLKQQSSGLCLSVELDLAPCLVRISQYAVRKLGENDSTNDIISCVILIEYFCILEELLRVNSVLKDLTIDCLLDVGLRSAAEAYGALGRFSSAPLEQLFSSECLTAFNKSSMLDELLKLTTSTRSLAIKTEPTFEKMEQESSHSTRSNSDDYDIGIVRVRADLLAVIRRLVRTCEELGGHHLLQRAPTIDPVAAVHLAHPLQVSVDGTM